MLMVISLFKDAPNVLAVESIVQGKWPDSMHAVISEPHARKGEQLVLITTQKDASYKALSKYAKAQSIPEIQVPRIIAHWETLPVLGSGKIDIASIQKQYHKERVD